MKRILIAGGIAILAVALVRQLARGGSDARIRRLVERMPDTVPTKWMKRHEPELIEQERTEVTV